MKALNSQRRLRYGVTKWTFQSGKIISLVIALICVCSCRNKRPADAADASVDIFTTILESASENLLHDDFDSLTDYCDKLREDGGGDVDVIVDNAGFELITDLALAQHLVESGVASCVTFQLKSHVSLRDCAYLPTV